MDLSTLDRLNPQKMHLPQQLLFWLVLAVLVAFPVRIHTYNDRPPDDANRHVAKAISGKAWPEILLMDEQYQFLDHNEGWHFFRPWVEKMTPADRMILRQENEPAIPVLEWRNIAYQTWSGRLPREAAVTP